MKIIHPETSKISFQNFCIGFLQIPIKNDRELSTVKSEEDGRQTINVQCSMGQNFSQQERACTREYK